MRFTTRLALAAALSWGEGENPQCPPYLLTRNRHEILGAATPIVQQPPETYH